MFSFQFLLNRRYERFCGNTLFSALVFTAGINLSGLLVLLAINRFVFEFTPFTLLMAFFVGLDSLGFVFCSLKSFAVINLSLYSVLSMLGGMALPFVVGLVFYDEKMTIGKALCFVFIVAALLLTVKKDGKKGGFIWYAGIFILNGMSGVLSKVFQASELPKTSPAGFSVLSAAAGATLALMILSFIKKDKKTKLTLRPIVDISVYGALNKIANFLLLISLEHLPASAQYPFVTGGVMICSTAICAFTDDKPSKKEIAAVVLSFIGIMALVIFDRPA